VRFRPRIVAVQGRERCVRPERSARPAAGSHRVRSWIVASGPGRSSLR
jgi:hypothetical protein